MSHTAKILLRWVDKSEVPRGQQFSVPARFAHQDENWIHNAWSLVITTEGQPDATGRQAGTARFLSPEAPHDWLAKGKQFTLFTSRPIAEAVVEEILAN
jgi:hypothetical protein